MEEDRDKSPPPSRVTKGLIVTPGFKDLVMKLEKRVLFLLPVTKRVEVPRRRTV